MSQRIFSLATTSTVESATRTSQLCPDRNRMTLAIPRLPSLNQDTVSGVALDSQHVDREDLIRVKDDTMD